jgi:hypothetical protein
MGTVSENLMKINMSEFSNKPLLEPEVKLYTKQGQESYVDEEGNYRLSIDNNNVYAKAIKDKRPKHFSDKDKLAFSYYIKTEPNNIVYNPIDRYTIEPKTSKSFINKICKSELIFTEVPENVFKKYLTFLRTESVQLLQDIQREIK